MSIRGCRIRDQKAIHFITFAVVGWVDVFTRNIYRNIVVDSIKHCLFQKGLNLHAWCLMTNHIHLMASSKDNNLSDILRDFKKFTSREIIKAIENNLRESRRSWMLRVFREHGALNPRNDGNQFWRQDNHPEVCFGAAFTTQKINYIHRNPVAAGIVDKAHEYLYSSARDYFYMKNCGLLDIAFI